VLPWHTGTMGSFVTPAMLLPAESALGRGDEEGEGGMPNCPTEGLGARGVIEGEREGRGED